MISQIFLENDTEMVDHSMIPEFLGVSYDLFLSCVLLQGLGMQQ